MDTGKAGAPCFWPEFNYTIDGFLRFDFVVGLPAGSDYLKVILAVQNAVENDIIK